MTSVQLERYTTLKPQQEGKNPKTNLTPVLHRRRKPENRKPVHSNTLALNPNSQEGGTTCEDQPLLSKRRFTFDGCPGTTDKLDLPGMVNRPQTLLPQQRHDEVNCSHNNNDFRSPERESWGSNETLFKNHNSSVRGGGVQENHVHNYHHHHYHHHRENSGGGGGNYSNRYSHYNHSSRSGDSPDVFREVAISTTQKKSFLLSALTNSTKSLSKHHNSQNTQTNFQDIQEPQTTAEGIRLVHINSSGGLLAGGVSQQRNRNLQGQNLKASKNSSISLNLLKSYETTEVDEVAMATKHHGDVEYGEPELVSQSAISPYQLRAEVDLVSRNESVQDKDQKRSRNANIGYRSVNFIYI